MTTESEICARFAEVAREDGWTVYPERAKWDLVLVWEHDDPLIHDGHVSWSAKRAIRGGRKTWEDLQKSDLRDRDFVQPGDQFAIEAKKRADAAALCQCLNRLKRRGMTPSGPDFTGIVAQTISNPVQELCRRWHDIDTFEIDKLERSDFDRWLREPPLIEPGRTNRRDYDKRLWLPPVVPENVVAGEPSPSALTPWRIAALRLCVVLRCRGYVTKQDFDRHDAGRPNTWKTRRWIRTDGSIRLVNEANGREYSYNKYVPIDGADLPDVGWEDDRDKIVRESPGEIPEDIIHEWNSTQEVQT